MGPTTNIFVFGPVSEPAYALLVRETNKIIFNRINKIRTKTGCNEDRWRSKKRYYLIEVEDVGVEPDAVTFVALYVDGDALDASETGHVQLSRFLFVKED